MKKQMRYLTLLVVTSVLYLAPATLYAATVINPRTSLSSTSNSVPLTLENALQRAMTGNDNLALATQRLRLASLLNDRVWTTLLPNINASGKLTRYDQEISFSLPGGPTPADALNIVIQQKQQYSSILSFNWTLFTGRVIPLNRLANGMVKTANLQFTQVKKMLQLATVLTYLNALATHKQYAIRVRSLTLAKAHLTETIAQVEVGNLPELTSLRAQTEVEKNKLQLLQSQNGERLILRALAELLGDVASDGTIPAYQLSTPSSQTVPLEKQLINKALNSRLDLKQAEQGRSMAEAKNSDNWLRFLPALVATGNYRVSESTGFSGKNDAWEVAMVLQWNLLEGGRRVVDLRESTINLTTAQLEVDRLKKVIVSQVRGLLLDLENAKKSYQTSQKQLQLAEQMAAMTQDQFDIGAITQLELLDANRLLADARVGEVLAQLAIEISRARLLAAMELPTT